MKIELMFITPNAEKLIETSGRTSRLSFEKQGKDTEKKFIRMIIKMGHFSALEHAYATFKISGVSRAFTHQLVRHRMASFTQQSQRYIEESNFNYVEPGSIINNSEAHLIFTKFIEETKKIYSKFRSLGIKKEDARYILPNAIESQIVATANLREWRHIIELRGAPDTQWEIRKVAIEILKILKKHVPTVLEDFEIDEKKFIIRQIKT